MRIRGRRDAGSGPGFGRRDLLAGALGAGAGAAAAAAAGVAAPAAEAQPTNPLLLGVTNTSDAETSLDASSATGFSVSALGTPSAPGIGVLAKTADGQGVIGMAGANVTLTKASPAGVPRRRAGGQAGRRRR